MNVVKCASIRISIILISEYFNLICDLRIWFAPLNRMIHVGDDYQADVGEYRPGECLNTLMSTCMLVYQSRAGPEGGT